MTQKEKQLAINHEIDYYLEHHYTPNYDLYGEWERLDYCSAWTQENDKYVYLQSYNTLIAFIDKETGVLYDLLRKVYGYTATSAKHIAKFRHKFRGYITTEFRYYNV